MCRAREFRTAGIPQGERTGKLRGRLYIRTENENLSVATVSFTRWLGLHVIQNGLGLLEEFYCSWKIYLIPFVNDAEVLIKNCDCHVVTVTKSIWTFGFQAVTGTHFEDSLVPVVPKFSPLFLIFDPYLEAKLFLLDLEVLFALVVS